MGLSADQTFAIAGMLLGVTFLLSLLAPHVIHFYVPELSAWKYYRVYTATFSSTHTMPVVVVLPLPDDDAFWSHVNPDGSDIRVTIGTGRDERILPSMLVSFNYSRRRGKVAVLTSVPSTRMTFRLYYGNPEANAPEPFAEYHSSKYYAFRKDVSPDHWTVKRAGSNADSACQFTSSDIRLVNTRNQSCAVRYYKDVPYAEGTLYVRVYGNRSGADGIALWLFRDFPADFVPPTGGRLGFGDDVNASGYAVIFDTHRNSEYSDPYDDYVGIVKGGVQNHIASRRYTSNTVQFYVLFKDDKFSVRVGSTYLKKDIPVPSRDSFPFVVSAASGGASGDYRLQDFYFQYAAVSPQVTISAELAAPTAPRIVVNSPAHDAVFPRGDVSIDLSVTDPNRDLAHAVVLLDGNVLREFNTSSDITFVYTAVLSDGQHTLDINAVDAEGILNTYHTAFFVDTRPPVVDVNAVYDGSVLSLDVNASDLTLDHCYYTIGKDGSPVPVACSGRIELTVSPGTTVYFYAVDRAGYATFAKVYASPPRTGYVSSGSGSSSSSEESAPQEVPVSTESTSVEEESTGHPLSVAITPSAAAVYVGAIVLGLIALRVLAVI